MKYCVMVIAIGDIFYKADAKEVLVHYFEKHEIPYVFIEEYPSDVKEAHPSWLKMICHRILPGYDTIICWDLDLLPASPDVKVMDDFHIDNLCLVRDSLATDWASIGYKLPHCPDFKYNGGLICIPTSFKHYTELVFDAFAPGTLPWWEQLYLNNIIFEYNLSIYELPTDMNTFYSFEGFNTARLKHYRCGDGAKLSIAKHKRDYFSDTAKGTSLKLSQ